jgi:hypothetical protein
MPGITRRAYIRHGASILEDEGKDSEGERTAGAEGNRLRFMAWKCANNLKMRYD